MAQALHVQLASITSMEVYRRQNSAEQPYLPPAKRSRNRGIVLSRLGWQKLMQAGALCNELGERYTYEQLSERSHLDERTVSRLLSCEAKVDKRTLKTFFQAFDLSLEAEDYLSPNGDRNAMTLAPYPHTVPTEEIKFEQLVEELIQLKQRLREYDRLFHHLGLDISHVNQQLRA